jgi:hypothetical protein
MSGKSKRNKRAATKQQQRKGKGAKEREQKEREQKGKEQRKGERKKGKERCESTVERMHSPTIIQIEPQPALALFVLATGKTASTKGQPHQSSCRTYVMLSWFHY